MAKLTKAQTKLLADIVTATNLNQPIYVAKEPNAVALATYNPPLIEVNPNMPDPTDAEKAAARATDAGKAMVANTQADTSSAPSVGPVGEAANTSTYAIITNAELPKSKKRGGGAGAPVKYPFDQLELGQSFFVPATDKQPNPAKSLGSTISSQNLKNAEKVGERETVRTKRGPKNRAVLDEAGNKVKETVKVPVWKYNKKFSIRPVEAGQTYGGWIAPANGALVARIEVSAE